MKGLFITFEGIEGSGKSTQVRALKDWLEANQYKVLLTREPGGPRISEEIRKLLLNPEYQEMLPETELLLYMASRSQHTGEWIIPALNEGKIVICDRYFDSTIAYQGAARKIDLDWIDTLIDYATYSHKPDITFLLDIPVEVSLSRIAQRSWDRIENETIDFHKRVRNGFLELASREPSRIIKLDGTLPQVSISERIINETMKHIQ